MTAVVFKFVHPDGTPVADAPFVVSLRKSSFDEKLDVGILLPGDVQGMTDANGTDTLELMAGFGTYYLTMSDLVTGTDSEGCASGLRYRFQVPESDTPVRVEDIIVTTPTFSRPWDEVALQVIIDAKTSSQASANAAAASATEAKNAALQVKDDADRADAAALAAGQSEQAAGISATAAQTARNEAEGFRDQSRTSELAAGQSATLAGQKAGEAAASVLQAQEYAEQAEFSASDAEIASAASVNAADASAASATQANAAAVQTAQDKQATAADRTAVSGLKDDTVVLHDEAKTYRDEALAAVGTFTGAFVDGGLVDLSGGAYPTKPDVSTIWKVQVGGTVTTVKEGTIVYAAGDGLVYTKTQDTWYKNDSQNAVVSVNGKQGAVVLTKADIGLPRADNTNDAEKPISDLAQVEFDKRVPTTSRTDTTAGHLVKVGDFGENGGGAIVKASTDDANLLTVPGTYIFNGGGLNIPENTVYIKHFNHAVANWSKQIAYGMQTNKVFVRTLNNGTWSDWGPAVEIVDALTSSDPAKALSARQGKILLEMLQANNATIQRFTFNLSAGQSTITGNSLEGIPLSYVPGVPFMVEKDGFPIWFGTDYTASNGSSITLVKAATQASEVAITVFGAFSVANHYTKAEADLKLQQAVAQSAEAVMTIKWVPSRQMIPEGCVPLDGGTYSRTTYLDAWNIINTNKLPVVTEALWSSDIAQRGSFTKGDGSTNFRVPDYNAKASGSTYGALFVRGDGNKAAVAGFIQSTQNLQHSHTISTNISGAGEQAKSGDGTGNNNANRLKYLGNDSVGNYPLYATYTGSGGDESRPNNVSGVWVIRLFGSVSNVGNVDVAQLAANLSTVSNKVAVLETANQKIYMCRQIGNEHLSPTGAGTIVHWGNEIIKKGGITYSGISGGRSIVVPIDGVYRVTITVLSQGGSVTASGITMVRSRAGVNAALMYGYSGNGGETANMVINYIGRFNANDGIFLKIEAGGVLNTQDGGQYNSFIVERIDD